MLAHELRNPLSPIVSALDILRARTGRASFIKLLDVIDRQARHLTRRWTTSRRLPDQPRLIELRRDPSC